MKNTKSLFILCVMGLALATQSPASATVFFQDNFDTAWSGDYAPGWVNSAYRHGEAPVGKMMQQSTTAHSGTYGMQLTAFSTPQSWMWWAAVSIEALPASALLKQYNPYVSAWYYDGGSNSSDPNKAGQLFAVPSWVNPYINGSEDWTDTQFGARFNQTDQYYYVAAGENGPGWQATGVARSVGWHNLKIQLSSTDGKLHYILDGTDYGSSYRDDYNDLGTEIGLYTMFQDPLSIWGTSLPYTIWDDVEVGSSAPVPEPATMLLIGSGLVGLAGFRKRFRKS